MEWNLGPVNHPGQGGEFAYGLDVPPIGVWVWLVFVGIRSSNGLSLCSRRIGLCPVVGGL